jgi:hypothetical protein
MQRIGQSGPQHPSITHSCQDQLIYDFVKRHVNVVEEGSEGLDVVEYEKNCVFGDEAFSDLFDAMEK